MLGGASCRVTLDEIELGLGGVALGAVGQLTRQAEARQGTLALHLLTGVACRLTCLGCQSHLIKDGLGLFGMLFEIVRELLPHDGVDDTHHLIVAEFGLGLTFELRLRHLHRDDGRQAFAEVIGRNLHLQFLQLLQQAALLGIGVERTREARAEALEVGTAFNGVNIVDIRVQVLLVLIVVFQSNLYRHTVSLSRDGNRLGDEFLAVGIEVGDEVDEAVLGIEDLAAIFAVFHLLTLVGELDGDAVIEVSQLTHAVGEGAIVVFRSLEDGTIGLEGDACAVHVSRTHHFHIVQRFAALIFLFENLAFAIDLCSEMRGQRVDAADTHAVQTTGNLIGALVELTASVQHGQHDLKGRTVFFGVHTRGDTTAVVEHTDGVAGQDADIDLVAIACHGFVDGVVDHFIYQMMQAAEMDVADIHGRTLTHGLQALKHLDLTGTIFFACQFSLFFFSHFL